MESRKVKLETEITKEYINTKISEHAFKMYNELNIDLLKHRPVELIAHMGINTHRWHKILHKKTDVLFREAVAYFDYWYQKGKLNSLEDLFTRVD